MIEETVLINLSFAFHAGSVDVQVQQERRIVRDDGTVAMSELLPHEQFVLARASTAEKALLKKVLGSAHASLLTDLHGARAELESLTLAKGEMEARLANEKAELHAELTAILDSAARERAEIPTEQEESHCLVDNVVELQAQLGSLGRAVVPSDIKLSENTT